MKRALEVLIEENMVENARVMGEKLDKQLREMLRGKKFIKEIRSKGLFIGIEFNEDEDIKTKQIVTDMLDQGVICKQTQQYTIRMAPPLIIDSSDVDFLVEGFRRVFSKYN